MSKRGFNDTVTELYNENNTIKLIPRDQVSNLIESVNQIRGNLNKNESVLFEWWKVFWNILKETKQASTAEGKSKRLKRSYPNDNENDKNMNMNMKIIIEEGTSAGVTSAKSVAGFNTRASSNPSGTVKTSDTTTEHPYKKLKKKPVPINSSTTNESMNTLDISSLTGIEKSLLSTNLMNKDLTKLTVEEGKRIETALTNNKVSKESWEIYLRLCKEYQKMPQVLKNPKISKIAPVPNPDFISCNSTNYLGVIDQVNQPIDSRQLLLLRQSLYQEYLKKQSNNSYMYCSNNSNNGYSVNVFNTAMKANNTVKASITSNNNIVVNSLTSPATLTTLTTTAAAATTPASVTPNFFDDNIFGPFEIKDELNFNDFMNEYLI